MAASTAGRRPSAHNDQQPDTRARDGRYRLDQDARGVPASREVLERGGSMEEAERAVREQDRTRQPL
jgi:hypothetical protein